jgi:hypothetical protein
LGYLDAKTTAKARTKTKGRTTAKAKNDGKWLAGKSRGREADFSTAMLTVRL